jgi:hypothetical protein
MGAERRCNVQADQIPGASRVDIGTRALTAVRLGSTLNADHSADPGALRSIGTCRICGFLSYQTNDGTWKHVPAVEECEDADQWLRQHQPLADDGDTTG